MAERAPPRRRRRRRQRWALTVLGLVFAVSALLRAGTLDGAFAGAAEDAAPPVIAAPEAELAGALRDAMAELEAVRADLAQREAEVADRERAVAAARRLVEDRLAELEAAETRLSALISTSDSAAETDLDRLTRVYETMPPERAAGIFARMEPSFAAGFLGRMAPAASATLMAELPPEQAHAVSVLIATRNSSAPRMDAGPDSGGETEN